MRVVGRRGPERPAARTNTMSRCRGAPKTAMSKGWAVGDRMTHTAHRRVILDLDSSESPVHGKQEGASYNGHFGSMCYHPLFVFNQFGDCEGAMLRAGNVHSAHRWRDVLDRSCPATGRQECGGTFVPMPHSPSRRYLEERHVLYAISPCCNVAPLLRRPVRRPPKRPVIRYDDFWYRAGSWDRARRVVAKVEWPGESCSLGWASSSRT